MTYIRNLIAELNFWQLIFLICALWGCVILLIDIIFTPRLTGSKRDLDLLESAEKLAEEDK
jgi:hypothetical protein